MTDFVSMFHEELDTIYRCPEPAVPHYEDRGWVRVDSVEPEFPVTNDDGEIDWEDADDAVDSQEEASTQEDD